MSSISCWLAHPLLQLSMHRLLRTCVSTFQTVGPLAGSRYPVSWMSQTAFPVPCMRPCLCAMVLQACYPPHVHPCCWLLIVRKGDLLQNSHLVQLDTMLPVCEHGVIRGGLLATLLHVNTVQISLVLAYSSAPIMSSHLQCLPKQVSQNPHSHANSRTNISYHTHHNKSPVSKQDKLVTVTHTT